MDGNGFDRRSVLQGLGGLGSLAMLGKHAVEEADTQETATVVPDEAPDLSVGVLGAQVSVTTTGGTPFRSAVGVDDTEFGADATYESYVQCIRRDVNGRGREDIETYTADVKFHQTARGLSEGRRNAILRTVDGLEGRSVTALTAKL